MTEYLPQLILAWSIQWVGVLSPGPSVALILAVATGTGRMPSLVTAFGVACGSIILALATVLGITVIFAQIAELMTVVRFVGASYLVWLAYKAFRKAARLAVRQFSSQCRALPQMLSHFTVAPRRASSAHLHRPWRYDVVARHATQSARLRPSAILYCASWAPASRSACSLTRRPILRCLSARTAAGLTIF